VGTETLIWGIRGVDVKAGVGDSVAVGVKVGIGEFTMSTGITASAVCVKPTTIVCTMAVFMEFESDVEIPGTVQAWETINKAVTNKRIGVDFSMFPPFISNGDSNTKTWNHTLLGRTFNS
jgi:hypothetical protein